MEVINNGLTLGRIRKGISGEAAIRGMDELSVLAGCGLYMAQVTPDVRAKRADMQASGPARCI